MLQMMIIVTTWGITELSSSLKSSELMIEDPFSLTAARCGVNDSLVLRIVFFMYCLGVESGP